MFSREKKRPSNEIPFCEHRKGTHVRKGWDQLLLLITWTQGLPLMLARNLNLVLTMCQALFQDSMLTHQIWHRNWKRRHREMNFGLIIVPRWEGLPQQVSGGMQAETGDWGSPRGGCIKWSLRSLLPLTFSEANILTAGTPHRDWVGGKGGVLNEINQRTKEWIGELGTAALSMQKRKSVRGQVREDKECIYTSVLWSLHILWEWIVSGTKLWMRLSGTLVWLITLWESDRPELINLHG